MSSRTKAFEAILTVLLVIVSMCAVSPFTISTVKAAPDGKIKALDFYFHNDTSNPYVGSGYTQTTATLNPTRNWREMPQGFINASGTLVLEFYVHPDLAANVTFSGALWLHLWMCGWTLTGATPKATFKADIYEVVFPAGPTKVVSTGSSGSMELAYGSTPAHSRDVNSVDGNSPLNLTFTSHTFTKGSSILLRIEVVPGAGVSMSFYYDHAICPSYVTVYSDKYAQIASIKTYDADYAETNMFSPNWTGSRRKVVVQANVTDPFGGYDIYMVNASIFDPVNQSVLDFDNVVMTRISDGLWTIHYSHVYEANWSYPEAVMLGNYTVKVSVVDNKGNIEHGSHVFNIGVIVLHNPAFKVVDDVNTALSRAEVYVTLPNGTTNASPLYTNDTGFISLTGVPTGNYSFKILWKSWVVQQTSQYVDSDGPYTIKCQVYQLTLQVLGNNGVPVHGAYAVIYTQAGIVYDFKMTDASGQAVFQLPSSAIQAVGPYRIETFYSTAYWLTYVAVSATEPSISVISSRSVTVTFDGFPPAIWTTTLFWLIIALIIVGVLGTIAILYKKGVIFKGKTPKAK